MRLAVSLLTTLLALILTACASPNKLGIPFDGPPPGPEESIVVVGASPSNYYYHFLSSKVIEGRAEHSFNAGGSLISAPPTLGYIVARVPAGFTLAMSTVSGPARQSGPWPSVVVCRNSKAMVFEVPKGKVIYVGNIYLRPHEDGIATSYGQDFAAARGHVDMYYPNLVGRLEPWKFELLPTWMKCRGDKD